MSDAARDDRDRVSVVICAHSLDRWEMLVAAIGSALEQMTPPHEIVVVVDHNEELRRRLTDHCGDQTLVRIVSNDRSSGLSGARNTGVAAASGGILAFLDDDATAEPDWLAELCAPFDDSTVMAAGGRAVPVWNGGTPSWFPEEYLWVVGCTYRGAPTERAEIRNPIGCNMAIRRSAFDVAGEFVEGVGRVGSHLLGCEETLFCIELRQRMPTARIVNVPDAVVRHRVEERRHHTAYFRRRCFGEGLSKAQVARRAGSDDGLSSERTYVTRTLPSGVVKGVVGSVRSRTWGGLQKASMIIVGFVYTVTGFVVGSVRR